MVSSLNTGSAARSVGYNVLEVIATRIQAVAAGSTVTARIGKIPAGSIIARVHSRVAVAITGGTPVLSVGSLGDAGLDDVVATMAETAGSEDLQPLTAFVNPLTSDKELYASIAGGATAGDAWVSVEFFRPQAG
jgi:hypothetical protein